MVLALQKNFLIRSARKHQKRVAGLCWEDNKKNKLNGGWVLCWASWHKKKPQTAMGLGLLDNLGDKFEFSEVCESYSPYLIFFVQRTFDVINISEIFQIFLYTTKAFSFSFFFSNIL